MNINMLKQQCKTRGLKVSGNKTQLIDRLQAFDDGGDEFDNNGNNFESNQDPIRVGLMKSLHGKLLEAPRVSFFLLK